MRDSRSPRTQMSVGQLLLSTVRSRRRRSLLVILLLLSLERGLRKTVQITLTGLCDTAATLVLVVLNDTDLLKRLHDLAVDGSGRVDVVRGAGAAVLGGSVDLAKTADTDSLALFAVVSISFVLHSSTG